MAKKLNLEIGKIYLTKDVFNHPSLTIIEVRLLTLLSSLNGLTLEGMNKETKMWLCKDTKKYNLLSSMNENLKTLGLINQDGTGKTLSFDGNYISFDNMEEIDSCKSLRQLFIKCCLSKWDKRYANAVVSKEMFGGLFGESVKRINENWDRTVQQTGLDIEWKEMNGSITFKRVEVEEEVVVEEVVEEEEKQPYKADIETKNDRNSFFGRKLLSGVSTHNFNEIVEEPMFKPDFDDMGWS